MSLKGFILPAEVLALRPFVTTDADVVETNLVEIEFGFFGLHTQRHPGADEPNIGHTVKHSF